MKTEWTVGKKLALGFGLALALLLIVGGVSYWSINSLIENANWVAHTHQVLENLEAVISLLKDAETGQRGFVLTRQDRYLEPYQAALVNLDQRVKELRRLTEENDDQQRRIDSLEPLIKQKLEELRETIDLRRKDKDPGKDVVELQNAKGLE